jgi:hypothetical protein
MAAISIPQVGESFLGERPQVIKVAKVTLGFNAGDVQTGGVQATYPLFNIPANTLILDVYSIVLTAWTASVTITLGDGDAAAGYLDSTEIAPQTAITTGLFKRSSLQANTFSPGKVYLAADTIDAVIAGANPAAGKSDIYIEYIENVGPLD